MTIQALVKVDVAVACTNRRHAALSCVRRFNKIQWTQVGLHRSEPRLSGTATLRYIQREKFISLKKQRCFAI